ncbi:MAG: hypothetical protein R3B68_11610 [Phycisphaerales bacterium]
MLPKINPTGTYTDRQYDRVRGFRALVHAEFEAFLEDRVVDLANRAFANYGNPGPHSKVLLSLLAFHDQDWKRTDDTLRKRIDKARTHFVNMIKTCNHGIREENIKNMLIPVGIEAFQLDEVWLGTIDTYGRDRGIIAHTAAHTQQPPDPSAEHGTVVFIMQGFKDIDEMMNALI